MVEDLRTLRSALAELPDIPPSRPLRFLPPIPEPTTTRPVWLGVLRGITAPAMAIGVIMILVGAIGTTGIGSLGAGGAAPALTSSGAGAAQASVLRVDHAKAVFAGDGRRSVDRSVVDDDHLEVRVLDAQKRLEAVADGARPGGIATSTTVPTTATTNGLALDRNAARVAPSLPARRYRRTLPGRPATHGSAARGYVRRRLPA